MALESAAPALLLSHMALEKAALALLLGHMPLEKLLWRCFWATWRSSERLGVRKYRFSAAFERLGARQCGSGIAPAPLGARKLRSLWRSKNAVRRRCALSHWTLLHLTLFHFSLCMDMHGFTLYIYIQVPGGGMTGVQGEIKRGLLAIESHSLSLPASRGWRIMFKTTFLYMTAALCSTPCGLVISRELFLNLFLALPQTALWAPEHLQRFLSDCPRFRLFRARRGFSGSLKQSSENLQRLPKVPSVPQYRIDPSSLKIISLTYTFESTRFLPELLARSQNLHQGHGC
jgi:hypothetical protein